MTTARQRRRWRTPFLIVITGASATNFFGQVRVRSNHQRYPNEVIFFRGGAQPAAPSHRQQPPPPPPPRRYPSNGQKQNVIEKKTFQQQKAMHKGWIPPPPRRRDELPPHAGAQVSRQVHSRSNNDDDNTRFAQTHEPPSPIPPPPRFIQKSTHAEPRTRPPPPPHVSSVEGTQRQDSRFESKPPQSGTEEKALPFVDEHSNDALPVSKARTSVGNDVLFLVPPKDELDRISLQTVLSARPKKEQVFANLIQLRQHMAIEKLILSQQSVKEQMTAVTNLLQELVRQQQETNDSLVVYAPRTVASIPPRWIRRRVEKVRTIPRQTILSSLEEEALDRDLSDGEFDTLIEGLREPSEVEEIYHEYEYDEEYSWQQDDGHSQSSMTPNAEDVNAFLRESSESESLYPLMTTATNEYDSDGYYDDYYDMEPIEDELLGAWGAVSDFASASDGAVEQGQGVESSGESTTATSLDGEIDFGSETTKPQRQPKMAQSTLPEISLRRQETSPPPPHRPALSQRGSTTPRASSREANQGLGQPPLPTSKLQPRPPPVWIEQEGLASQELVDDSEELDDEEVRLLQETALYEEQSNTDTGEMDEGYDDDIDEKDLRILQFSRWIPFSGRKKRKIQYEDDFVVDDDVLLDEVPHDDATTDDFTDFELDKEENETSSPVTPLGVLVEESSEDEMLLGESAVTHAMPSLRQIPPPPPRPPPPRPPITGVTNMHTATRQPQQPPGAHFQQAGSIHASNQYSAYTQQIPPVPPTVFTLNPDEAYRIRRPDEQYRDGYP